MNMLKSERPALSPVHFLIIFGQKDSIQLNYPKDFFYEQSIRELILPRKPEEIEKVISQSSSIVMNGSYRFPFTKREAINNIIKFNGKSARCGLSLEQFQSGINKQEGKTMDESITLPNCCFYPKWVPSSRKTKTERAWKCYNCWEVVWMPLDFKLDRMTEKISESERKRLEAMRY